VRIMVWEDHNTEGRWPENVEVKYKGWRGRKKKTNKSQRDTQVYSKAYVSLVSNSGEKRAEGNLTSIGDP